MNQKSNISFKGLISFFFLTSTLACQTSPIVEFSQINLGQDKSDVIEHAGGPTWSDRRNGLDRWTYILYQDGVRLERQVLFSDGIVAYVGDPIVPFISAEEQDKLNAEKNMTLDRMESANSGNTNKIPETTKHSLSKTNQ